MRAHVPPNVRAPAATERPSSVSRAKLTVGPPGDRFEREADRIAKQVLQWSATAGAGEPSPLSRTLARDQRVQCKCTGCEQEDEKLRAKPVGASLALSPALSDSIDATRGGGAPLPAPTRAFFEPRFGADLGDVRVHRDAHAHALSHQLDAHAFTIGRDIYFGAGRFAPESEPGRRLIAHELAHTLQQRGAAQPSVIRRSGAGNCARDGETIDERRDELALAGRLAHAQIQGVFSAALQSEVPVPRATKGLMGTPCPPGATPHGRADLFRFSGGLDAARVGEIKSVHGARFAAPDVTHYLGRLGEVATRMGGTDCGGRADAVDRAFDTAWLQGQIARGQTPPFRPLDYIVPPTPTDMGPFAGDPLRKELFCERRAGGAVIYWCRLRNLDEDERQRERQRLRIPVGEDVRRTQPRTGRSRPAIIDLHPDFREAFRQMPHPDMPNGRDFVVVASDSMYSSVVNSRQMVDQLRRMRVDLRSNPVYQFRQLTWLTAAIVMGTGLAAGIIAAIGVAAAPTAAVATGVVAGGAAAAGGGATVIPLFAGATATATEAIKAAAAIIIVSSVALHGNDAHAAADVDRAIAATPIYLQLDVTDDARGVGGGPSLPGAAQLGGSWTVDGQPYRVIAVTTTN